jgi:DNA polymerase II large subunit
LESAFGKVSKTTAKNPKQAIQMEVVQPSMPKSIGNNITRVAQLKTIEELYNVILKLEDFLRKPVNEKDEEEFEQQ